MLNSTFFKFGENEALVKNSIWKHEMTSLAARRTEAQWSELMDRVYALEDQQKNAASNERVYKHQVPIQVLSSLSVKPTGRTFNIEFIALKA